MVPDKFNMVDMGGIDIIESQGMAVEGLYQRLVESIALCHYQCLYNWKFNGILIPPSYVEMKVREDGVWINEGVMVDENDVIYINTGESVIESLSVTQNGTYTVPSGVDGYNPVTVNVPSDEPSLQALTVIKNGTYLPDVGYDGFSSVIADVPTSGKSESFINYDFTKCIGTINQITYSSIGATFPSSTGAAFLLLPARKNDITIYIDVGKMNLSSGTHRRFLMRDSSNGFIYRSTGVWSVYMNSWEDSQLTDGSLFNNSKVKFYIDANGYWHIYKNNILIWEPATRMSLLSSELQIGSTTGTSIINSILTGLRIYDGNYTET